MRTFRNNGKIGILAVILPCNVLIILPPKMGLLGRLVEASPGMKVYPALSFMKYRAVRH